MYRTAKLLAIALVAALATAFGTTTAGANTVTAEPSGAITATSIGKVTFGGGELSFECRVTLRGSVERTINNAAGGRVGSITGASLNECGFANTVTALFPSSWAMELASSARLEGAIDVATINVLSVRYEFTLFGVRCLYGGSLPMDLEGEGSPVVTRNVRILENLMILESGGEICPSELELVGAFRLTTQTLRL